MEPVSRIWFTPKQRAELWERWRSGQCVADIARALRRRNKSGVQRILALHGGISPRQRRRRRGAGGAWWAGHPTELLRARGTVQSNPRAENRRTQKRVILTPNI